MCGIVGYLDLVNHTHLIDKRGLISSMISSIAHRGPDAVGLFCNEKIGLGHARLSIIDLSSVANQPMTSFCKKYTLVFNGEIYNFRELRKELMELGVNNWRSQSDTEVILNLYVEFGFEGIKKLEGVFAIAIWDSEKLELSLFRDRLGVKPLYYSLTHLGIGFSSEISSLHKIPEVNSSIDDQSLSEYLWYGNTYGERTFFKGIRQLEPGCFLIVKSNKVKIGKWWCVEEYIQNRIFNEDETRATEQVLEALDNAVSRQMVSDVPLALFLSGGLDSSAIAASARSNNNYSVNTYSAGFDFDKGINELSKARKVASYLGLNHNEIHVDSTKLEEVLLKLSSVHGEPFADAANIPLYLMCSFLPKNIKVVLQGDGGDELFAGYRRYSMLQNINLFNKIPSSILTIIQRFGITGNRIARIAYAVGNSDPAMRMALLLTTETLYDRPEKIFSSNQKSWLLENTDPFMEYKKAAERFKGFNPIQQMLLTDLTVQLPSQFLTKVDRATMAAGIEARVPLLDEGILKLVLNMPINWKVKNTDRKVILRNSQINRLPSDIVNLPKTGFGVPTDYWLANSLSKMSYNYILDNEFIKKFDLKLDVLELMLKSHKNGNYKDGNLIWKLLQLSIAFRNNVQ